MRCDRERQWQISEHVFNGNGSMQRASTRLHFALRQTKTGKIDFREFCTAVAICCLSSSKEQINFVFDLFDEKSTGRLSKKDVQLLLETAARAMHTLAEADEAVSRDGPTNGSAIGDSETDSVIQKQERQWVDRAQAELLESCTAVSREQFLAWASTSLDVSLILNDSAYFLPRWDSLLGVAASSMSGKASPRVIKST